MATRTIEPPAAFKVVIDEHWEEVKLTGDYAGGQLTMLMNPRVSVARAMMAGPAAVLWTLHELIREWNFVTPAGEPIPLDADGVGQLPQELVDAIAEAWGKKRGLTKRG